MVARLSPETVEGSSRVRLPETTKRARIARPRPPLRQIEEDVCELAFGVYAVSRSAMSSRFLWTSMNPARSASVASTQGTAKLQTRRALAVGVATQEEESEL